MLIRVGGFVLKGCRCCSLLALCLGGLMSSMSFASERTSTQRKGGRIMTERQAAERLSNIFDRNRKDGEGSVAGNACATATGDCCAPTGGTPGCGDLECCETVCGCDAFCCDTEWDEFCAGEGFQGSGCGAAVLCESCGGGGQSTCCIGHATPGCDDAECQADVCACDSFCCTTQWDECCATDGGGAGCVPGCGAQVVCPDLCGGGGTGCDGATGDCCAATGGPGCGDPECCSTVCACDPFCCDTEWDDLCAGEGFEPGCGAAILCEQCGGGGSNCCFANGGPGCDTDSCEAAVCGCDPFCCNNTWDDCCATNGGGAGCVPGCGAEVVCGDLCSGGNAPPNDLCANAIAIGNGTVSYSNVGALEDGPALPASCEEGFGLALGADLWYNYTAPSTGMATVDLCAGTDYDARIAVYDGCGCPAQTGSTLECDDDGCCPGDAGCAASMTFPVVAGQCYKLRIGGFGAATGLGEFVVSTAGTMNCPSGTVTFTNPVNGTVDARQPNPVNSPTPAQGISTVIVTAPVGAEDGCFRMCETAPQGSANSITGVTDNGAGTYTITLARPITMGAVTRVSYTPTGGAAVTATFTSHPANVNADNLANSVDILRIIDCLNNVNPSVDCPWGIYSRDMDHSNAFNAADILRVIDLLNGADVFQVWNGTQLPNATCTP